jgi:peptidoglycan biosynthesis protein MviN/MurJ (putative lipid II flippase)
VDALFTGVLTAAFFDARLATAVFFVAITNTLPNFFRGLRDERGCVEAQA